MIVNQHSSPQTNPWIGRLVGDRYQIDRRLGGGGMGDVFLATDTRLGKSIALKLLKESLSNADLKARFERECAICAALKSSHIVQVSDYGLTSEGFPFYVMEYLQGQTLGQLLFSQPRLSIEQTCNIITQVCAGLQAAHTGVSLWHRETNTNEQIKVVHRDLKPDNIFLTPTALGEFVRIIDFGIAKIQSLQTEYAATTLFMGTCHYASPEQFDGGIIDERSDIYSLGIILYEMLSGTDPFGLDFRKNRITNNAWLAAHAMKDPQPLRSQLDCDHISPALEAVVMRCLEKAPSDRFASAEDLRMALQAAVARAANEMRTEVRPIAPRPARRRTAPIWLSVGATLLTLAVAAHAVPQLMHLPIAPPTLSNRQAIALAETLSGSAAPVWAAVMTPDGQTLVSAGEDRVESRYPIKIWDVKAQQVRQTLAGHGEAVRSLSLSADGKILASGSADNTIRLWNLQTGELIRTLEGHSAPVASIALNADGRTLVSGSEDRTVKIWDVQTGARRTLTAHTEAVYSVALSPDGGAIASGSADKTIRLWDTESGELVRTLGEPGGHRDTVGAVAFSPDGQQLVSGGWDGFVKLWNASTGQLVQTFEGHSDRVVSIAFFNPQTIASASFDHTIKLWQPPSTSAIQTLDDHTSRVLAISAADRSMISSSSDTTIKIWR
ncbi:MAG: protein kinase [Leptolyngbyaceae cyanobacterium SM1_3_5]|nr:protein kinase [Leptolyngbyaceae cyanobacterium SM1_3_5]